MTGLQILHRLEQDGLLRVIPTDKDWGQGPDDCDATVVGHAAFWMAHAGSTYDWCDFWNSADDGDPDGS